jgi:hypothetical protein
MAYSWRDEDRHPGLQIHSLILQFQFPLSFEDIINFVGPFMVMLHAIEDVCHMDIDLWSIPVSNNPDALTAEAVNDLRSVL